MNDMDIERRFRSDKIDPLSNFPDGVYGTVVDINADPDLQGCLMGMGLFVGTRFQLLRSCRQVNGKTIRHTPFLLAIGETRIALGYEIAKQILVEA